MKTLRMTKQKALIIDELKKVKTHPTAQDVYEMVKKTMPNVSLGTVYRNLEALSERGEIQRLAYNPGKRRYDGNALNHPHLCCRVCGRVDDMPDDAAFDEEIMKTITDVCGYKITDFSMELFGICPQCLMGKKS
jgi:Fur family ferric uptake transcriptional regulator